MERKVLHGLLLIIGNLFCCSANASDTIDIKWHLTNITQTKQYRNYRNINQLNSTADYIRHHFLKYSDSVWLQEYEVDGNIYKNVIASFGTENNKRIIVGAHYDVCDNQPGADDNASGVVALLELAKRFKAQELHHRIDLVAYTLEEPPFFKTEFMGSYVHSKYLKEHSIHVLGMVSIEMIGYFKDDNKSQKYPIGLLSLFYGNKGDYITLVKKFGAGRFANRFTQLFKSTNQIKTKEFIAPKILPGIDFSDHLNYWLFGYSALMITDTSFYRNPNYHQSTDTIDTLDLQRMSKVINSIFQTLVSM